MYQFLTPSHQFPFVIFLNRVHQQKYFLATQDFCPVHCSVNTEHDESYYPSWHTTFCTICPKPFSFRQFLKGQTEHPVDHKCVLHFLLGIKQINKTAKVHTQHTDCSTSTLLSALDIQYV